MKTAKQLRAIADRCLQEAIRVDHYTITKFPTAEILRDAGESCLEYANLLDEYKKAKKESGTL